MSTFQHRPAPQSCGQVEVICGGMYSGKSEELISRLKRVHLAKRTVQLFQSVVNTREEDVTSRCGSTWPCTRIRSPLEIFDHLLPDAHTVGIDECQFFPTILTDVVQRLCRQGLRVICAGLDMDHLGNPFEPVPRLLAIADFVTKTHAVCHLCGERAYGSYRTSQASDLITVGDDYLAVCRSCLSTLPAPTDK